ncbi:Ref family protein [Endozoicomonas sp. Mp262]|uniref:Ref family protein n=1 Tax=Endozoicomonas sp. Mp262 TaxID=2919499 RepID=UPI0021D95E99
MKRQQYKNLAASIGCLACEKMNMPGTPAQLHHPRAGQGMAQRASDYDVIPLCREHHQGSVLSVHMTPVEFKFLFGTEQQLSDETRQRVADLKQQSIGGSYD